MIPEPRWMRQFRCWATGGHDGNTSEWGYGMDGMVDLYCTKCGVRFDQIPLEDFEGMQDVFELIEVNLPPDELEGL